MGSLVLRADPMLIPWACFARFLIAGGACWSPKPPLPSVFSGPEPSRSSRDLPEVCIKQSTPAPGPDRRWHGLRHWFCLVSISFVEMQRFRGNIFAFLAGLIRPAPAMPKDVEYPRSTLMATTVRASGPGDQPPRGGRVASHDPSRSPPLPHLDWAASHYPPFHRPGRHPWPGRCLRVAVVPSRVFAGTGVGIIG
jgi:hypothetical protein